jgi:cytochrome c553
MRSMQVARHTGTYNRRLFESLQPWPARLCGPPKLHPIVRKMKSTQTALFAALVASATLMFVPAQAQEVKGDAKAGQSKIALCIGCHGIQGYQASFPEIYKVPKISGQGDKYIVNALTAYQKGDRKHPTMRGVGETLTEQDIADIASYYSQHGVVAEASLPAKPSREPSPAVAQLLQKGACVSCHGANFAMPIDPTYPKIAGQYKDYLFVALKAYKTEGNAKVGRANGIMGGIAKQFSNDELKAMAGYIGSLDGDLKTVAQSKFR